MSKLAQATANAAARSEAPAAPAPAAPSAAKGALSPVAQVQPRGEHLVIQWNNDTQDGATSGVQDAPAIESPGEKPPGAEAAPAKTKDDAATDEPAAADPPAPKPAKPSAAERREVSLAALESERRARSLEATLKTEQTARAAEREQLQALNKAIKEGSLGDLLAARGMTPDEALELLLVGGDKVAPTGKGPAKPLTPEQQELADLKATVAALKAEREAEKGSASAADVARALAETETITKDLDIPVTRAVENGHELVLRTAWELWAADGKTGQIADYMPDAAARAEAHFRKARPALAALADRAAGKETAKGDTPAAAAPSIGRRAGGAPAPASKTFWKRDASGNLPSREEIDEQIKRELNFRDKM